jgi:hypothetical protein
MKRITEFYESNHLLVLIIVVTIFVIYVASKKNRRISIKTSSNAMVEDKLINSKKELQPTKHILSILTKTNQGYLDVENLSVSYFILDKNWYDQNKIITVTFIGGNYDGRIFNYNHDEVYIGTIEHYQTLDSWKDYGRFSNSRNIPEIALKFVTEIIK